jgi:hypothetical protein
MDIETVSVESWRPADASVIRANMRRLDTSEDTLLLTWIETATRYVEHTTKTSILGRRLRIFLPEWPGVGMELPAPPLRFALGGDPTSAVTIRHRVSGSYTATPAGCYTPVRSPQVWCLFRGDTALPTIDKHPRAVEIAFDVGYRDLAHLQLQAPELIDAIVLHVSHRDSNREATINEPRVMAINRKVEHSFDALIAKHIVRTRYTPLWI